MLHIHILHHLLRHTVDNVQKSQGDHHRLDGAKTLQILEDFPELEELFPSVLGEPGGPGSGSKVM